MGNRKHSVNDVLKQIPEKELRKFVAKELGIQEVLNDFMQQFKKYFLKDNNGEAFVNQINNAFMDADEEFGFINFHEQSKLLSVAEKAALAAVDFIKQKNYIDAIDIAFAILENGIDVINHSDDSMGYLGSIMNEGTQVLCNLTDPDVCVLDEDSRLALLDKCKNCISQSLFEGWEWHVDMYDIIISIANCDGEYADIMEILDSDNYFNTDYYRDQRLKLKLALIRKWKGEKSAQDFLLNNLQVTEFREKAVEEAFASANLQRAYQLALDGISQDEKDRPGLVHMWHHWMLRTAQKEDNTDLIIKYASLLYIDPFNQHGDFYNILKKTVPTENWKDFVETLARQAIDMGRMEKYADLCSREKWYDKLMEYVEQRNSKYVLKQYETELLPDYRDRVINLYIQLAVSIMDSSYTRNRKGYQELCRHLKHATRLGGGKKVVDVISDLQKKYARNRALIEELSYLKM